MYRINSIVNQNVCNWIILNWTDGEADEGDEDKEAVAEAAAAAAVVTSGSVDASGSVSGCTSEQRTWNCSSEQLKEVVEEYKMGKTNLRQVELVFDEWKNRKDVKENASMKRVSSAPSLPCLCLPFTILNWLFHIEFDWKMC